MGRRGRPAADLGMGPRNQAVILQMMPEGPVEVLRMRYFDQTVPLGASHLEHTVILRMGRLGLIEMHCLIPHCELIYADSGRHPDVLVAKRRSLVELPLVSLELARLLSPNCI